MVGLGAAFLEVGGEVLVGVAPVVGADDPDLLAAQPLPERLEGHDLVGHAHHPLPAAGVGAVDQLGPVAVHPVVDRDALTGRVVGDVAGAGVAADQAEGGDDGLMGGVGGAELQHLQQLDQALAVVVAVGGAQGGLHDPLVGRAGVLELGDHVAQGPLPAGHHRVHDLAHAAVWAVEHGLGGSGEHGLLAGHPAELVGELLGDPALGAGADAVHRGDQQVHQGVSEFPLAGDQQRGQQRQPQRLGMGAQVGGGLHRGPQPPADEDLGRDVVEQSRRKADGAHRAQLGDLGQHRLQADIAGLGLDPRQQPRPCGIVAGVVLGDQGQEPADHRLAQPAGDPQAQGLLGLPQRRAHEPVDATLGGRLDPLAAAVVQQLAANPVLSAFALADVLGQPSGQLLGVRDRALPEPQVPADLRAVVLDRAAGPLVEAQLLGRDLDLASDELDRLGGQLAAAPREPALLGIELQQQREPQARRGPFAGDQVLLVVDQRPVLDQVIKTQGHQGPFEGSSSTGKEPARGSSQKDQRRNFLGRRTLPHQPERHQTGNIEREVPSPTITPALPATAQTPSISARQRVNIAKL